MPLRVYWAHERWLRQHETQIILGTPHEFATSTHAAMAHHHRRSLPADIRWLRQPEDKTRVIIVMTTVDVLSRAPESLTSYVIPAAWVLNEAGGGNY